MFYLVRKPLISVLDDISQSMMKRRGTKKTGKIHGKSRAGKYVSYAFVVDFLRNKLFFLRRNFFLLRSKLFFLRGRLTISPSFLSYAPLSYFLKQYPVSFRKNALTLALSLGILIPLSAQDISGSSGTGAEALPNRDILTERSYSPDTANLILIAEQSRSPQWNLKNSAILLISDMLDRGTREPEMLDALEYLAFEGTVNKTQVRGRTAGGFSDIRAKAAVCLGAYGGEEARKILLQILRSETDIMPLREAVNALSRIGMIPSDEIVLNDMMARFNTLPFPDNLLALSFLSAYAKYGTEQNGSISLPSRQMLFQLTTGAYTKLVKSEAKRILDMLDTLRKNNP